MMRDHSQTEVPGWLREIGKTTVALALALLATVILVLVVSEEPGKTLSTLATAPLSSKRTFGLLIDDAAKLTLAGLGFALVFQARQFALGVQGQAYVGGLTAALVALAPIGVTHFSISHFSVMRSTRAYGNTARRMALNSSGRVRNGAWPASSTQ